MAKEKKISELRGKLQELYHIGSALAVLNWDMEVFMPPKGAALRAGTISNLSGILHEKFISKEFSDILKKAKVQLDAGKLDEEDSAIVRELWREYERQKKLPVDFVREMAQICSEGHNIWADARKKSDFNIFLPHLKKIVALKRREAELVGWKKSPYDALLESYEPFATSEEMSMIFEDLKKFLVPYLKKISDSSIKISRDILKGNFPIEKQKQFNEEVAKKIGFDFEAGRLDTSVHPFSTGFHPNDVRMTTRFEKDNLLDSFYSVIHETGHALYEQGLSKKNFGTPLGEAISLGIHESQSRMWENTVARGKNFWEYFFPKMQKEFPQPFAKIKFDDFFRAINFVRPSLIRVESDEVTYNLHIILRFEIEKELIEGSIEVEDLPKIWNAKMEEYLGVAVPNDKEGVLQDVHWSGGAIGYFPSYTLGNLYAAQFFAAAKKDMPNLEKEIAAGEFSPLLEWLREKIHMHGKFFSAGDLVREVTGESLTSQYFIDYLKEKFGEIYNID
ncbi:MAG TPA: carboxypeptidase M32 [Candidatus Bathyarchaeia archaeon]|nr:carboxypeptidase M32 [Candidatus Bathyarchaeia archaeon]